MADSDKNIKITPNTGQTDSPKIEVTGGDNATKTLTINDDGSMSFDGTLSVSDLTVSGTTTTLNTETLTIDDNIIVLNNNVTGTPSENAGIEIERGTSTNATFLYDESIDGWVADSKGTGRSLKVENQNGYIEFGPQNTSYAHITTDRARFYFNRDLVIGENAISSYNGDFSVRRSQDSSEQIVIGDNSMTFTSAGNDVVTVDGTNNRLGVGVSAPSDKLHVAGNILVGNNNSVKANGTGVLILGNTDGGQINVGGNGSISFIEATSNSLHLRTQRDQDDIIFSVNAGGTASDDTVVEAMRIHGPDGYIGISDTTPVSELDMGTGAISFANTNTQLKLTGTSNVDLQISHWANAHVIIDSDGNDSNRYFSVRHGDTTAGSATELFRVQEDGKVGVGTSSPSTLMHLSASDPVLKITDTTGSDNRASIWLQESDSYGARLAYESTGNDFFNINIIDGGTETTRMVVTRYGNVGIGTTDPGERLHVSGGNVNLDAGYYYGFRDRTDLGVKEDNYTLVLMAPEQVEVLIDSNNNNTDDSNSAYFTVRKNSNTISGSTELFRVNEAGNVGIGATDPQTRLHIRQDNEPTILIEKTEPGELYPRGDVQSTVNVYSASIAGAVSAGATSVTIDGSGASDFASSGRAEIRARQDTFTYTGKTDNGDGTFTLTGIPSSGDDAITATDDNAVVINHPETFTVDGGSGLSIMPTSGTYYVHRTNDSFTADFSYDSGTSTGTFTNVVGLRESLVDGDIIDSDSPTVGVLGFMGGDQSGAGNRITGSISMVATSSFGDYRLDLNVGSYLEKDPYYQANEFIYSHETIPRMSLTQAGNVGIGTTTPENLLHIVNDEKYILTIDRGSYTDGDEALIRFSNSGANNVYSSYIGSVRQASGLGTGSLVFGTSPSSPTSDNIQERMRILNTGNVGIGTTSPDASLEVEQSTTTGHAFKVYRNQSSSNMDSALVYLHDDSQYADEATLHVKQDGTGIAGIFEVNDAAALEWIAELRNTPNPQSPTTFGAGIKLALSSGSGNELLKWAGMAAVKSPDLNYSRKVDAAFYTQTDAANGVAPTEKMRITGDGDVGIGTTSPSFTSGGGLEIEHTAQANLRVTDSTASASSDFAQSENDLYIVNRKTNGDIKIRVNSSNELITLDGGNQTVLMASTSMGDANSKVGIAGKLRIGDIANTQDGTTRAYLHVDSGSEDPGGTSGDFVRLSTLMMDGGSGGNNVMYSTYALRNETGTSWTTLSIVDGVRVDTDSEVLKADGVTGSNLRMWHEIDAMAAKRHWGHIDTIGMTYHQTGNGRLGIGTTSPSYGLEVVADSDAGIKLSRTGGSQVELLLEASSGDNRITFSDGGTDRWCIGKDNSDNSFRISDGGSLGANDRITITSAGNVGIGTSSPNRLVEIQENGTGAAYLRLSSTNTSYPNDTIFGGIEFYNADASGAGVGATIDALSNGSGRGGYLQFRTDPDGSGSPSVRMTIDENGNVGIGTSSPDEALEIMNGSLKITREETESSVVTEDTVILDIDGGLRWNMSIAFDDPNPIPIGTLSDQDVRIIRGNATHTRWFWNRTSFYKDVGIGTENPNQKLTVEGSMSLKEQASANTDTAAYGQLWVKSDSPNNLYFTNDAGNDVQITDGSSLAGGGSASPAGSDSQVQYNNGGSFGGDADFTWDDTNNRLVIGSVTSQHDGLGKLTVKGTDASFLLEKHDDSASGGPTMTLYRYSASVADGDLIGQVNFRGEGSTGNPSTYMSLRTEIVDTTEGTKDAKLIMRGLQGNTQTDFMEVGQKVQIGPESVNPSGITTGKVTISRDSTDETTDGPTLMLVDGDDDSSPGPVIKLYRNTASPADNDVIGQILFSGEDSAGGERTYGSISARTLDVTSGTRDSEILLKSTKDGADVTTLTLYRGEVKANLHVETYKPAVFMDSGNINVTTTEVTIPFDTEILDPAGNATLATGLGEDGHIRLVAGGYYRISYSIPINDDSTAAADRTRVFVDMQTSSSSAFSSFSTVAQSRAQVYTRENSGGSGLSTSFIYEHTANDYIRLRIDAQLGTDISTETNECQISIEYLGPA